MKKKNDHEQIISEFIDNLSGENLDMIDFDQITDCLKEVVSSIASQQMPTNEFSVLKSDYIGRISGMAKALGVASKRNDGLMDMLQFIESLDSMSAEELVEAYRRIAVKFRSAFPASFGLLKNHPKNDNNKPLSDYQ